MNISEEWVKKIDILEGIFKSFKVSLTSLRKDNFKLNNEVEKNKASADNSRLKEKQQEEMRQLSHELKEEKKQR